MSVIIDEMDAEVTPPTKESRGEHPPQKAPAPDERKIIAAFVYEQWLTSRLIAD